MKKRNLIGVVASAGGHLTQLMQVSNAWANYPAFYVSTSTSAVNLLKDHGKVYIVDDSGRGHFFGTIKSFLKCIMIVFKEKPEIIITSGAGSGLFLCIIGKMIGTKNVWLDSIANVDKLSLGCLISQPFIDLCIVQWEDLAFKYKKAEFWGKVI